MTRSVRKWPLALIVVVLAIVTTAQTGANTVPATKMKDDSRSTAPNDMKPPECASITVTAKLSGSGTFSGTSAAELITGSTSIDWISGGAKDDCLVGGDDNDILDGGSGTDVCLSGAGVDTFIGCETQLQ